MTPNTLGSPNLAPTTTAPAPEPKPPPEYPDWSFIPDPEPVEDAMQQEPTLFRIVPLLKDRFEDRPDALVAGGGFLCYDRSNLNARLAPDCIITFGVDPDAIRRRNAYLIWEVGKPPDLVIEVASESTAQRDIGRKRDLYAAMGVAEYWRMDATGGRLYGEPLVGEYLLDGEYRRYELSENEDGVICAHSDVLGLNICWGGIRFELQDPQTGEYLRDSRQAEARAEREAQARRQAEAKNRRLRAELEALRRRNGDDYRNEI